MVVIVVLVSVVVVAAAAAAAEVLVVVVVVVWVAVADVVVVVTVLVLAVVLAVGAVVVVVMVGWIYNILLSQVLIILQNNAAQLLAASSFPVSLKSKAVYFIKREQGPVPKEEISQQVILGDMAVKPIEQLAALVDEASVYTKVMPKVMSTVELQTNSNSSIAMPNIWWQFHLSSHTRMKITLPAPIMWSYFSVRKWLERRCHFGSMHW